MSHTLFHRQRHFLIPLCLALVVLADYLFYGHTIGWVTAIIAGIAAAAVAVRSPGLWRKGRAGMGGRIALALCGFMLLALVEEPSPLAMLMTGFCLGMLILIARGGFTTSLTSWFIRWTHLVAMVPVRFLVDAAIASKWFRKRPAHRPGSLKAVLPWVIPILAGVGFLVLFTVANPIIQQWASISFDRLLAMTEWLPLYLQPSRVFLWLFTGIATYGLLRHRGRYARISNVDPVPRPHSPSGHHFIIRCLVVFNLVFALQSILDILYLFGGAALPRGMTYAHYAHRGAYPLIATALLAGLFTLITFRTGGAAHRSRAARQLVYLWLAQNIFLLVSTVWRLWLYIDAYSLTRLRLATVIWIILVAVGFLLLIAKITLGKSGPWLWRTNALTLAGVLYVCAFINFPGIIASFNVHHCKEVDGRGAALDIAYLEQLGPAALPALEWVELKIPIHRLPTVLIAEHRLRGELKNDLSDWRSWTWRRHRIAHHSADEEKTLKLTLAPAGTQ